MISRVAALRTFLVCAVACTATVVPICGAASIDPGTIAQAKTAYAQIAHGKLDRSALTPALAAVLSDAAEAVLAQQASVLGTPDGFVATRQSDVDGVTTTVFRLHFSSGILDFAFGTDDATHKIAKLYFVPGPSNDPTQ